MDKRYQVFVSSTSLDLKAERREVIEALLSMDCIPAGMELFPATDDDQMTLIKRVIDQCDYYLVILAGKYGSVHPTERKSYTRLEYEYALAKKKPVIAFLHSNLASLPLGNCEQDSDKKAKLEEFRELAKSKLCKFWDSTDSLVRAVYQSVFHLIRDKPAGGWVRAEGLYDENAVLKLENSVLTLEKELQPLRSAGLVNAVTAPYSEVDWRALFNSATKIDLLFAYARTWRWSHTVELKAFACKPGAQLRVILPDPEYAPGVAEMARRFGSGAEGDIKIKIREAAKDFDDYRRMDDTKASISVWYYPFAPLYSLIRFDNTCVLSLYSHRPSRAGVVTFVIGGGSIGTYLFDEFDTLIKEGGHARKAVVEDEPETGHAS